jgi:hypothetical protein
MCFWKHRCDEYIGWIKPVRLWWWSLLLTLPVTAESGKPVLTQLFGNGKTIFSQAFAYLEPKVRTGIGLVYFLEGNL